MDSWLPIGLDAQDVLSLLCIHFMPTCFLCCRSLQQGGIEHLKKRIADVATRIAAAHGCTVDFKSNVGYPPTVNDPKANEFAMDVASR